MKTMLFKEGIDKVNAIVCELGKQGKAELIDLKVSDVEEGVVDLYATVQMTMPVEIDKIKVHFTVKENKTPYDCVDCKYRKLCYNQWGEEHEAVTGTHHCRRSWEMKPVEEKKHG